MNRGELVPDSFVVDGLEKTIKYRKAERFLIDGFPRNID